MAYLTAIIGFIFTLFIVVGFHELGHFLIARAVGIQVLRFSIGFGKALISFRDKKGTEYCVCLIPLGGYVKMLDESEEILPLEKRHLSYTYQPLYKKLAVIIAGPLANLILAFLLYWSLFIIGFTTLVPTLGAIPKGSIAATAGLHPNDEIISVNHQKTASWMAIYIQLLGEIGNKKTITLEAKSHYNAIPQSYTLDVSHWHVDDLKPDPLQSLGFIPYEPLIPPIIGKIQPDSPASKSALQKGDIIVALNNIPINNWSQLNPLILKSANKILLFKIKRQHSYLTIPIPIASQSTLLASQNGYLGISADFTWPKELLRLNKYSPLDAWNHAYIETKTFTYLNFILLGKMIAGKISLQSLGGPLTIFESAGTAINNGIIPFMGFLAFLSISIGIMNILPIPGLDGSHLLFQLIASLTRRPLSERAQLLLFRFGFIFLMLLLAKALTNDILRLN